MKITAIVGFGFCGRLAFFHLAKKSDKNTKILIFEKGDKNNLGPAFSSFSPHYILNVPAIKMSAFSDDQKSFCRFLEKNYPQILEEIGENGFAPRKIYGEYLDEITREAFVVAKENGVEVEFVADEVVEIINFRSPTEVEGMVSQTHGSSTLRGDLNWEFALTTKNKNNFQANEILLATSFKQSDFPFNFDSKNLVAKLWNQNSLPFHQKNFSNEKICLIGSGLTAVDVVLGLKKKNFDGKIFVISRRGNFPKKHFSAKDSSSLSSIKDSSSLLSIKDSSSLPSIKDSSSLGAKASEDLVSFASELQLMGSSAFQAKDDEIVGVLEICLKIRKFLRNNPQLDLRHVIDSIRPIATKIWQNFDEKNRRKFLRLLPYWNIFRHRAPADSVEVIEQMIKSGQLEIKKKGVKNLQQANGDKKIIVETCDEKIECDYLVNCLGFEFNAKKYPLLAQMIAVDLLEPDLFLVKSNHQKIYLFGGLNIGRDFECTAVPDLRVSVENYFKS